MREGFYSLHYTGATGMRGLAVIVLAAGRIVGADAGGGTWSGEYTVDETAQTITATVSITLSTAGFLVTGVAVPPGGQQFSSTVTLPFDLGAGTPLRIQVARGPVNAIFRFLSDLTGIR